MIAPMKQLNIWIDEERHKGAPNPQQAILSTAKKESIPHHGWSPFVRLVNKAYYFSLKKAPERWQS